MQDRSNVQQPWFSLGKLVRAEKGWTIEDLLVRWNESEEVKDGNIEYVYTAHRFDYHLPVVVAPGMEAIEYYFSLETTRTEIIQLAQDLLTQDEGFDVE